MHLGELAAAKIESTAEPITFDWHGKRVRCRVDLPALPLLELAATGDGLTGTIDESDFMVVGAAFYRFLESVIDPRDWPSFKKASAAAGDGPDQLLPLIEKLGAAITGRPIEPPAASRDGRSPTTDGSTAPLPSREPTSQVSQLAG